jgi:predicted Ser/Thr protein kinase
VSQTQDFLPQPSPPVPPGRLGHYRVLKQLGRGGMGTVYLAHHDLLDRVVALKIPDLHSANARERFLREARIAAGLRHANICPVHEVGEIDGVPFLTMAYIDGRPLSELVRPGEPWPQDHACELVRKLALALDAAHGHGVIHRDLKPGNVLVDSRGEPVITDFGLALRTGPADPRLTEPGALVGTPAYMAPEQVEGDAESVGARTDIYALGVVLYELLTGRRPYDGSAGRILGLVVAGNPPPPGQFRPGLDPRLEAVCLKAMARESGDRYPSMAELATALTPFCSPAVPAAPGTAETLAGDEAAPTLALRPRRRRWLALLAGCAALVLLTIAAFAAMVIVVVLNAPEPDGASTSRRGTEQSALPTPSDRAQGRLVLTVEPAGATVYIDGSPRSVIEAEAKEPLAFVLPIGSHDLKVAKEGFEPWARTVKLEAGESLRLEVRLQPTPAPVDEDRRAARWVLEVGGTVVVDNKPGFLKDPEKLPAEAFHVLEIHVVGLKRLSQDGLANLAGLKHLRRVDFKGVSFPGDGLKHLRGLPRLREVSLGGCELRDEMLDHLLELPALESLDIVMTALGDSALPAVGKMKGLKSLYLSGTKVTDDGLVHLHGLKSLTYLAVNNTKVTQAGADRLKQVLPKCVVAGTQLKGALLRPAAAVAIAPALSLGVECHGPQARAQSAHHP